MLCTVKEGKNGLPPVLTGRRDGEPGFQAAPGGPSPGNGPKQEKGREKAVRFAFAMIVGRIVRWFGSFVNRSTNLPGEVACRLCPGFMKRFSFDGKIIAVTGSNGKTTTTNMIAHILRSRGYTTAINAEGSNMTPGIATTLLTACDLRGRVRADYVVLEVDERYTPIVFADVQPDILVVTNLFRDQVVRNGNPDIIFDKIQSGIPEKTILVLNGDDPISQRLAPGNRRVYFGMARTGRSSDRQQFLTDDCKVCPSCFHKLRYHFYHYNHIGDFYCESCGYRTPPIDFLADGVDFEAGTFFINKTPASVSYKTTFHVVNTTAAAAACVTAGLTLQEAVAGAATFEVSKIRYDEMELCGRRAVLMLTKQNAASLDQSISYALEQPEEKTVVLFVNNVLYTEKKDISWLYDVTFERMRGKVDKIVCSGTRALDIGVRLKTGGFSEEEFLVVEQLSDIKKAMAQTKGAIYILAASAFGNEDGILEALK